MQFLIVELWLPKCYGISVLCEGVAWRAGTTAEPHEIELLAAVDNKAEPEDLPLAPWP